MSENVNHTIEEVLENAKKSNRRADLKLIRRAYDFAKSKHGEQLRRSGEPYIIHPVQVAYILSTLGLDESTICAALLHDVIEDTDVTLQDLSKEFSPEIAEMVDGVTKLGKLNYTSEQEQQVENYRKMFLAMGKDIRVILIKLADRLHNMRTLKYLARDRQIANARETMDLYAPLANRLGMYSLKWELEDLSFKYLYPEEYRELVEGIDKKREERLKFIDQIMDEIRVQLKKQKIEAEITGRAKHLYSIFRKMQRDNKTLDQIYDLFALRIIVNSVKDCYAALGVVHELYNPMPGRFKDYISVPKPNMYQSLHTTLIGPKGTPFEVQIRTWDMHRIAEYGIAAHWKYKEGGGSEDEGELDKWLRTIKEILDDPQPDAIDFLDTIKLNLFASEIFVFTPKGEIKTMPQNSTALDFAFSLHTDIGSHCIGAKVNHKLVPLSHKLQSGDQVEVLTSKSQRVQPEWEAYATTARARAKIASILRKEAKAHQKEGEAILADFLRNEDIRMDDSAIDKLTRLHNFHTRDELFVAVGSKKLVLGDADRNAFKEKQSTNWKKFLTFSFGNKDNKDTKEQSEEKVPQEKINTKQILKLTEETIQKNYIMADCCHPIPGDDVLGYIDEQNRIIIHKRQCPVAARLKSSYGNRIIATEWDTHKELSFLVTIYLKGIDSMGLLNEVTQVISRQLNVNIRKLTIETTDGIFEGKIQLYVHDVDDVRSICDNLKQIQNIKQVTRIEG